MRITIEADKNILISKDYDLIFYYNAYLFISSHLSIMLVLVYISITLAPFLQPHNTHTHTHTHTHILLGESTTCGSHTRMTRG
jgi:hypothetical protein